MYYKILSEMNLFKPAKIFLAIALVIFMGAPKSEAKYAKLVKEAWKKTSIFSSYF